MKDKSYHKRWGLRYFFCMLFHAEIEDYNFGEFCNKCKTEFKDKAYCYKCEVYYKIKEESHIHKP